MTKFAPAVSVALALLWLASCGGRESESHVSSASLGENVPEVEVAVPATIPCGEGWQERIEVINKIRDAAYKTCADFNSGKYDGEILKKDPKGADFKCSSMITCPALEQKISEDVTVFDGQIEMAGEIIKIKEPTPEPTEPPDEPSPVPAPTPGQGEPSPSPTSGPSEKQFGDSSKYSVKMKASFRLERRRGWKLTCVNPQKLPDFQYQLALIAGSCAKVKK